MRSRAVIAGTALVAAVGSVSVFRAQEKEPVYIGARVCATCHEGSASGHQYSKWLMSKHSRAFALLSLPIAKDIATLSGVPQEPQKSVLCLGCHATGAEAEAWERDETFFIEDGVQCERCHGPGSEYSEADVMRDPEEAMRVGLRKLEKRDCLVCHLEKGSHVAFHQKPKLDIDEAWNRLKHPLPEGGLSEPNSMLVPESASARMPQYVGVMACASCHKGSEFGFQFSRWKVTPHALSYARLSTTEAKEIAVEEGLEGDPQRSRECLKCHVTGYGETGPSYAESFSLDEGVGCEACHGPGSDYQLEAVMRDPRSARVAGLRDVPRESCANCHNGVHGKPFEYETALRVISHPNRPEEGARTDEYKTPLNLALSPDSREILVACEASNSVIVVDVATRKKVDEIAVGGQPHDVTYSPDGRRAYVTNRLDDSLTVIDPLARRVITTVPVGDSPHGVMSDSRGEKLFVLNSLEGTISVLETKDFKEIRRLPASRLPWSLSLAPNGKQLIVTNALPRLVDFRTPSVSELTLLDAERGVVTQRIAVPGVNIMQGVAWHPSGEFGLTTMNRTKNLVPMTRLLQGWTITNGLVIVWRDGRTDQILLDEPHRSFPDPVDVCFTPDGRLALVTSSGNDRIGVVDVEKLLELVTGASPETRASVLPNHLGQASRFLVRSIPTLNSPRGIVVTADGRTAFVVNSLDDSLLPVDLSTLEPMERVDLGGAKTITQTRLGEQVFHSAKITFHRQFSCHTCHPDGHVDGITYDIEPDGLGVSPVDNRTLRGILDTAPFKWEGTNPSLQRQCGPRLAVFFTRVAPFTPEELAAVDRYISTIKLPPNRFRPLGAPLTEAQRRGKRLFERTMTNDGRPIPPLKRCINCHPAPLYTDRSVHDVGTRMIYDRESRFDTPQLTNCYDTAPYLHNGIAHTLEEIWTRFNPNDLHGVTNDMTKDQLNDLIEFLKTL